MVLFVSYTINNREITQAFPNFVLNTQVRDLEIVT